MSQTSKLNQASFYRVVTDSFIHEGQVYKKGELIPRHGHELDYSLGHHLIELYEPEESRSSDSMLQGTSILTKLLHRFSARTT